jgi:hypothetical protein
MMNGHLIAVNREWYCPNCDIVDTTHEARPHTQFHQCPGLRGLAAPLLEKGIKAKVEAHDREDYVGKDIPQVDEDGRPVMSITTTRDDGMDTMVLAPTAVIKA